MRFFTGQVSSAYGIVDKGCHSTDTKMLEFHLVHVYACDTNLLVTFHNDTVIRFVIEIGRAVDVVHFHTRGNARDRITVHFTRMDYDHEQAIMLHGKFCKFIQQVRNILRFRLSRLRVVVETVERVEDNDAAATADNEFMSPLASTRSGETLPFREI